MRTATGLFGFAGPRRHMVPASGRRWLDRDETERLISIETTPAIVAYQPERIGW